MLLSGTGVQHTPIPPPPAVWWCPQRAHPFGGGGFRMFDSGGVVASKSQSLIA